MRARTLLLALMVLMAVAVHAQDPAKPCAGLKDKDIPTGESNPFDLEFTTEALVVKASNVLWSPAGDPKGWTPFVDYTLDGQFSYSEDKDRVADLGIELAALRMFESSDDPFANAFANPNRTCSLKSGRSGVDFVPYAEVRGRFADIAKSEDDDWKGVVVGGAGAKVVFQIPALMALKSITGADVENPVLALTYYDAFVDNDAKNPASSDTTIAIDQVQLALTAEIPLTIATDRAKGRKFVEEFTNFICKPELQETLPCPQRPVYPYSLSIDLKAGKPTKGDDDDVQYHADVAVKMMQPDKKIGFVLRYRTGADLGFEYDQQLLAGIVYRLFQ